MSNSIWKIPDIKPDGEDTYIAITTDGLICDFVSPKMCDNSVDRWAYLTDIIAQADKAERLQNQNSVLLNYLMDFMHREKEYVAQYKTAKSVSTINGYHQRIKDHLHEIGIDD